MRNQSISKKGVMNQVINIFILVLVISVLAGMTFLFVISLKENTVDMTLTAVTGVNESGAYLNSTGYTVTNATVLEFTSFEVTAAYNLTDDTLIEAANYTYTTAGVITNTTAESWDVNVSYIYNYRYIPAEKANAYLAVNKTEAAGYNVTKYLTLLFLALIFGAVLVVVLRTILPYVNLGNKINSGF